MKRTGQVLPSRRMKIQNLKAAHEQKQPALRSKQGGQKDLLLRHPDFVAKSKDPSFEPPPLACKADDPVRFQLALSQGHPKAVGR